jgi:hypothetical protein
LNANGTPGLDRGYVPPSVVDETSPHIGTHWGFRGPDGASCTVVDLGFPRGGGPHGRGCGPGLGSRRHGHPATPQGGARRPRRSTAGYRYRCPSRRVPRTNRTVRRGPDGSRPHRGPQAVRIATSVGRDHPANLSILITGGKETNRDVLSSGERSGRSSSPKSGGPRILRIVVFRRHPTGGLRGYKPSGTAATWRATSPCSDPRSPPTRGLPSQSRVVWECSPNRVVDPIQG